MNAALRQRSLDIQAELSDLRDRLQIALDMRDYWRGKNPTEQQFWHERVNSINCELRIAQSRLKVVEMPGDGGPDEQRRLTAKEDWKREADEYA